MLLSVLLVALTPSLAYAWGETGHRTVTMVATAHLTEHARASVTDLLGGNGRTLSDIATWADEHREDHPETYDWHLVYMPLDAIRYERAQHCPSGTCIVEKIDEAAQTLRNPANNKETRVEALNFLAHLVGDIHMPLHALAPLNRPIGARIRIGGVVDALHLWWDNGFVDAITDDPNLLAKQLETRFQPERRRDWRQATPEDWANESFVIARDFVRAHNIDARLKAGEGTQDRPIVLPKTTLGEVESIVSERIFIAGLRLARILNESFK